MHMQQEVPYGVLLFSSIVWKILLKTGNSYFHLCTISITISVSAWSRQFVFFTSRLWNSECKSASTYRKLHSRSFSIVDARPTGEVSGWLSDATSITSVIWITSRRSCTYIRIKSSICNIYILNLAAMCF